jgi:hypothetical protein
MPCAVDTASRALANPEYYVLANNTPALCASTCGARGFSLSAVEYGYVNSFLWSAVTLTCPSALSDQCFCSNSYTNDTAPAPAPAYLCNMPCAGDASQACGGGWHLQIYSSSGNPAAAAALPAGWTKTMPCVVDDINRVFANASFAQLANNTPQVCAEHCAVSTPSYELCAPMLTCAGLKLHHVGRRVHGRMLLRQRVAGRRRADRGASEPMLNVVLRRPCTDVRRRMGDPDLRLHDRVGNHTFENGLPLHLVMHLHSLNWASFFIFRGIWQFSL